MLVNILLLAASTASAHHPHDDYGPDIWVTPTVTMQVNEPNLEFSGDMEAAIDRAVHAWDLTEIPGTLFGTTVIGTNVGTNHLPNHLPNDNVNVITRMYMFKVDPGESNYYNCLTPALTVVRTPGNILGIPGTDPHHIFEADIIVDEPCEWNASSPGGWYDVVRQARPTPLRQLHRH